jgi:hypothetical protein
MKIYLSKILVYILGIIIVVSIVYLIITSTKNKQATKSKELTYEVDYIKKNDDTTEASIVSQQNLTQETVDVNNLEKKYKII